MTTGFALPASMWAAAEVSRALDSFPGNVWVRLHPGYCEAHGANPPGLDDLFGRDCLIS